MFKNIWFVDSSSNSNIIGVSQNIIDAVTVRKMQNIPIVLSCLTNLERSSLVALTITCILALESDTPIIISKCSKLSCPVTLSFDAKTIIPIICLDVSDIWYRICSQRKNILNDMSIFQLSMQIVLQCSREFIKKSMYSFGRLEFF